METRPIHHERDEAIRIACPVEAHLIAGRWSCRFLQDRWWEELRDNANLELRIAD
jgi:hypothetical protein